MATLAVPTLALAIDATAVYKYNFKEMKARKSIFIIY
jgi:hypothetical protein